ncbi:MAG: hypothetical protein AAF934_00085 [Bacteroidota bacterium]
MLAVSQHIYEQLTDFDTANGVFNGDIYPVIAPQEAAYPICVYRLRELGAYSKAGINTYEVDVIVLHTDARAILTISDQLKAHFESDPAFNFLNGEVTVNNDKPDEAILIQTYNIKQII